MPTTELLTVIAVISGLTFFLILFDRLSVGWAFPLDRRISRLMVAHRSRGETVIMRGASLLGGPYGILAVTGLGVIWLARERGQGEAAMFLSVVVTSILYALFLKVATGRKRPSRGLEKQRTYSFPSAHTLTSTVMYMSLAFVASGGQGTVTGDVLLGFVALLIVSVGASRVYLGVHYPTDVLAGYAAGAVWTWVFLYLVS